MYDCIHGVYSCRARLQQYYAYIYDCIRLTFYMFLYVYDCIFDVSSCRTRMHIALLDNGILHAIVDWLAPLPGTRLPNLKIRETLLSELQNMPTPDEDLQVTSGICKALTFLKQNNELPRNRAIIDTLMIRYARERQATIEASRENDEHENEPLPKRPRTSAETTQPAKPHFMRQTVEREPGPGEKGFVERARVPEASQTRYLVRPKSKVEDTPATKGKKSSKSRRIPKLARNKLQRPVKLSINGRNML